MSNFHISNSKICFRNWFLECNFLPGFFFNLCFLKKSMRGHLWQFSYWNFLSKIAQNFKNQHERITCHFYLRWPLLKKRSAGFEHLLFILTVVLYNLFLGNNKWKWFKLFRFKEIKTRNLSLPDFKNNLYILDISFI